MKLEKSTVVRAINQAAQEEWQLSFAAALQHWRQAGYDLKPELGVIAHHVFDLFGLRLAIGKQLDELTAVQTADQLADLICQLVEQSPTNGANHSPQAILTPSPTI